jgi:hypothetical protein
MQLGFNLSNGVILIYLETHMGLYTQNEAICHTD